LGGNESAPRRRPASGARPAAPAAPPCRGRKGEIPVRKWIPGIPWMPRSLWDSVFCGPALSLWAVRECMRAS